MYKMIQSSVVAVILFAATLPSLSAASCGEAGATAPTTAQAPYSWRLAGKYRSYEAAYYMVKKLEARGYEAYMKKCGYYYCVYYR